MPRDPEILSIGPTGLDVFVDLAGVRSGRAAEGVKLGLGGACRNSAVNLAMLGADVAFLTQSYGTIRLPVEKLPPNFKELQLEPSRDMVDWLALFTAVLQDSEIVLAAAAYDAATRVFTGEVAERERPRISLFDTVMVSSDVSYDFWNVVRQGHRVPMSGKQTTCLLTSGLPLPTNYLDWAEGCDLFFINADEVAQLGFTPSAFCAEALARGASAVFVTAGREEGAWYASTERAVAEFRRAPKLAKTPVSPIGAGDAFAAGVVRALSLGMALPICVDMGLVVATTVISEGSSVLRRHVDLRRTIHGPVRGTGV